MKVIIKQPGGVCRAGEIRDKEQMEDLRKLVGGYVELIRVEPFLGIIANEEGLLRLLPPNCIVRGHQLVGTIVFVGIKGAKLIDVPMSVEEAERMCRYA